jgi:O-acetyl-ADP-ribose deacetylase (regulator of RNase III)
MEPDDNPSLLSVADQLEGFEEPDINSVLIQGLDEIWIGVEKRFTITVIKNKHGLTPVKTVGGEWTAKITEESSKSVFLPVFRTGIDSAAFTHIFVNEGEYLLFVNISGRSVIGSPFKIKVTWGSASQLAKWININNFLSKDLMNVSQISIHSFLDLYEILVREKNPKALIYRDHLLKYASDAEIINKIRRCVIIEIFGSIVDETSTEAIFVSHNSWMEWPKDTGYQAKILSRLPEKERSILVKKCSAFGTTKLAYGSTLIYPLTNLPTKNLEVNPKQLINTVTVIFKNRDKLTPNTHHKTTYEDLKRAITLGLSEAERKNIKSIAFPSRISKNYYYDGKNEEAVRKIIDEWLKTKPHTTIETLVIVTKEETPKIKRKRRGSLIHRQTPL